LGIIIPLSGRVGGELLKINELTAIGKMKGYHLSVALYEKIN